MCWAQTSDRKINLFPSQTSPKVGPGSYNIPSSSIKKSKTSLSNKNFKPRDCLPRGDFVTPGPGAYNFYETEIKSRPASSFFKSRTTRGTKVKSDTPAACDYGHLREWTQAQKRLAQTHHPKRKKIYTSPPPTANFLDEKGRLVRRDAIKHTEADIGPGTYDTAIEGIVHRKNLNTPSHSPDLFSIGNRSAPSSTKYTPITVDHRLPVKIKGEGKDIPNYKTVSQELTPPTYMRPKTGQNPVFQSSIPRKIYPDPPKTPGPADHVQEEKGPSYGSFPGVIFGSRSVRFDNPDNGVPGPSDYEIVNPETDLEGSAAVMKNRSFEKNPWPSNSTPNDIGPGTYNSPEEEIRPQMSPMFASRSERMDNSDNGVPGPADYNISRDNIHDVTIINSRYPKFGDWINQNISVAPSPENFTIDRNLGGSRLTISRNKRSREEKRLNTPGPGAYELTPKLLKHSYNSGVKGI